MSAHILTTRQILAGITAGGAIAAALTGTPHAQAATLFVPGTGSTKPHATAAVSLSWLDGNRFGADPVQCLCDSNEYPAVLGPGVGQASIDQGTEAAVRRLLANPDIDTVVAGSQGTRVAWNAASDPRLAGRTLHLWLYSDMNTKTGLAARFPGQEIPTTGVKGGVPTGPTDPNVDVTSISQEWDPISHFPKYAITYLWTLPAAALGFWTAHGALADPSSPLGIDYDGATVTKSGNVTTITLRSQLTPYGQLAVIAVNAIAGPQAAFVTKTLLRPVDDVVAGILNLGGKDVDGPMAFAPTPQFALRTLAKGFEKAARDLAAIPAVLKAGPKPVSTPPPTAVPSTTPSLVPLSSKVGTPDKPVKADGEKPEVKPSAAPTSTQSTNTATSKPKRPAPKASGNPVHDTVKTVQGVLKQFAPKPAPKAPKSQKAKGANAPDAGGAS